MLARTWLDGYCLRQLILCPSGRVHFASYKYILYNNSDVTFSEVKCQVSMWLLKLGSSEPGTPQWRSISSCYTTTNNVIMFFSFGTVANWIRCRGVLARERACVTDWGGRVTKKLWAVRQGQDLGRCKVAHSHHAWLHPVWGNLIHLVMWFVAMAAEIPATPFVKT